MNKYPALQIMIRYGDRLAYVAGGLVFLMGVSSSNGKLDSGTLVRSAGLAGATGFGVKLLAELNRIISDALLPQ